MKKQPEKLKVYLDTSVISYLEQEDAPEKMAETRQVWEQLKSGKYDIYISNVVVKEISSCTDASKRNLLKSHLAEIAYTEIKINNDIKQLAKQFIHSGILKQRNFDDCQHIAATIIYNCDIIISWNFKHIVNVETIRGVKIVAMENGYKDILIYPPPALLKEGEDYEDD